MKDKELRKKLAEKGFLYLSTSIAPIFDSEYLVANSIDDMMHGSRVIKSLRERLEALERFLGVEYVSQTDPYYRKIPKPKTAKIVIGKE